MHILTSYSQVRKALRSTGLSDTYKVKRQMMTMMNLTRWTLRGNFQSSKARAVFHQVCWENELKRSSIRSRQKVECFALVFEKCQLNCLLPQQVQWNYEIRVWTYWIWNTKLKIYQFQDFLLAGLSSYELGCLALEQGVLMERAGFAIWVSTRPLWPAFHSYLVLVDRWAPGPNLLRTLLPYCYLEIPSFVLISLLIFYFCQAASLFLVVVWQVVNCLSPNPISHLLKG